jgi:biotin carboxyl carrier protein
MSRPPPRRGPLLVRNGEHVFRAEVDADGAVVLDQGNDRLHVARLSADTYRVTSDSASWHVVVLASGDRRQAFVDGLVFELEVEEPGTGAPRRRAAATGALGAPMPARVREVRVEVGQEVAAGDVLVTLEAMKMELAIRAPRDGRVTAVGCREGEMVQQGVPLVELAP